MFYNLAMYCPECGAQNFEEAQFCQHCGQALPGPNLLETVPSNHKGKLELPLKETSPGPSWWEGLSPDWKGALAVTVVLVGLGFLSDLIPGLGFIFGLPFTILVYYIQGVLVGRYARRNPAYQGKNISPWG